MIDTTDRTFLLHLGGKIEQHNHHPLKTRDDLSMAYTPGVARVCLAIAEDEDRAFQYTIKRNTVAVVSDGTAVLGLGDIGPRAAMPVMEGKCCLFKEFAGVDAFPICLDTKDTDEIVAPSAIAPAFGGINLEDISAPRCFEIEERLKARARHPRLPRRPARHRGGRDGGAVERGQAHRPQPRGPERADHRTGCGRRGGHARSCSRPVSGTSSAADSRGALHVEREDYLDGSMNSDQALVRRDHQPRVPRGLAGGCDRGRRPVDRGLRGEGAARAGAGEDERRRDGVRDGQPEPRGRPRGGRAVRADHGHRRARTTPNQINNVLCFPGVFRGALDVRAPAITEEMKIAAARAIAAIVEDSELREDYIIPSVFNRAVAPAVASAVAEEARLTGSALAGQEVGFAPTEAMTSTGTPIADSGA